MISVDIRITQEITEDIKRIRRELRAYPAQALQEFRALTPVRSGNARRRTRLSGTSDILADYAYAERLDSGWSKQAPSGMTEPFERWVEKKTKTIFRN